MHPKLAPTKEAIESALAVLDNRSVLIEESEQDEVNIPEVFFLSIIKNKIGSTRNG